MRNLDVPIQLPLFTDEKTISNEAYPFPSTRYQGSKNKITDWIWDNIKDLEFKTALDAFGGTAAVSHLLKRKNKKVIYNDILKFNYIIGKALIENDTVILSNEEVDFILNNRSGNFNFIQNTFRNIFYSEEENIWLDNVIYNIEQLANEYKKAIAYFALFQSCIIKRPYNLFHRANLYLRTAVVPRTFGNKSSWDKPFDYYFKHFIKEANQSIFSNGNKCLAYNQDALELNLQKIDLVYFDPPYISSKGASTDYLDFYHFLEGISSYSNWDKRINKKYKHMPIRQDNKSPWNDKKEIIIAFDSLIKKYQNSKIIISYRKDGIPTIEQLESLLYKYKTNVRIIYSKNYKYVLSGSDTKEVLLIAE